ncbi:MAG: hypothetical protein KAS32_01495, partial [Candidatus Peribacteraceae bacterium]|nr:hypothetical protein [Candidatus Peribacteraceae bacterium]
GEMDNIEKLNKTIEKLHIGRINVLPSIELINQKLDNRFSIKTLRSTPKKEHLAESTYKNWSIYEAEEETDFGFFSAQTGNKFVLANNKEMLLRHLNPTSERINIDETKTLIRSTSESLGEINISSIKNLIEKLLPEEKDDNEFPSLPLGSGSILWSQEKRGSVSVWKFWNK